jgi:hypothetical protein
MSGLPHPLRLLRLRSTRDPDPDLARRAPRRFGVLACDIDEAAGVGAVVLDHDPEAHLFPPSAESSEGWSIRLWERQDDRWHGAGGSSVWGPWTPPRRAACGAEGQLGMLEEDGGCSTRSPGEHRLVAARGGTVAEAGFLGGTRLRVAAEVDHLRCEGRHVPVPKHGLAVVVWRAPGTPDRATAPAIEAVSADGRILSTLGPGARFDSHTADLLSRELGTDAP